MKTQLLSIVLAIIAFTIIVVSAYEAGYARGISDATVSCQKYLEQRTQ